MTAEILEIADAVVAELNQRSWSQLVEAERHYFPVWHLEDMERLHIPVMCRGLTDALLSRSAHQVDYEVDIGIGRKVTDPPDPVEIDPLITFAQEVADFFRCDDGRSTPPRTRWNDLYPHWPCIGLKNEPLYDPNRLDQEHLFRSLLTLTFRVTR